MGSETWLRFWGATDRGRVRASNQDDFLLDPHLRLAVVADGVGGQARGEVASSLAARVVREHLARSVRDLARYADEQTRTNRLAVGERIREAVQVASAQVFRAGTTLSPDKGMSCTLDAAIVIGNTAFVAHVGDSRTYLVRHDSCVQVTEDHSVLQEKVRRGQLTQEEADRSLGRNVITRSVGVMPSVRVDTLMFDIDVGERLVLCSDGLSRYVPADQIRKLVRSDEPAATLIAVANARGGVDNITAVVIEVLSQPIAVEPTTAARLELLRSFPLFERATYQELAEVNAYLEERRVKPGRLLFREGDPGSELYLLCDGEVVITRNGHHLATLGGRTVFGEMALVDAQARSASALITRPTTLLVLGQLGFEQLLRANDALGAQLLGGMLRRLSHVVRRQNEAIGTANGAAPTDLEAG